jgi:hypothetical protein
MVRFTVGSILAATLMLAQAPDPVHGIDTHYELKPYASKAEWEAKKKELRETILLSAGLTPMPPKTPLKASYGKPVRVGDATVEPVLLETMPGFFIGANLYKPVKPAAKMPVVLITHGHWAKGRLENSDECSTPTQGVNLARQGYMALAIDMVGYNDAKQHEHRSWTPAEDLWSYGPLGLQLWNGIRSLDFLLSLPGADPERVAVTGASGGGTQAYLLTAVDDRVRVTAPVNMISAYMQGGCVCENAPGLRANAYNVEYGGMAAPRPMLMVSCTGDWTRNTPKEEFPDMRKIYGLYDAVSRVENVHVNANHNYNADSRAAVYRFFAMHLQPNVTEAQLQEQPLPPDFKVSELAFGGPPPGSPTREELLLRWKAMSRAQTSTMSDDALRMRLRRLLLQPSVQTDSAKRQLWRPGKKAGALLIVTEAPMAAAKESAEVREALASDRPVLVLSAFRHPYPPAVLSRTFHGYNTPEGAARVQEIDRALAFLKANATGTVEIRPTAGMVLPALFAVAVSPVEATIARAPLPKAGDAIPAEEFFVPGIERAGGVDAALRLMPKGK